MKRAMLNEGAPEAPALPELPTACSAFMKLMGELDQVQRIESESASALPTLRAEAARANEAAEAGEGDAMMARIDQAEADKLAKAAATAHEAVRLAEKRGAAARRERLRLEAAILGTREHAGAALRAWGQDVARQHAEAYAAALGSLYASLGTLQAIQGATGASVLADTRYFRLPRRPTASDEPFAEVVAAPLPALDAAGDVQMGLEAAERLSWKHDRAA